MPEETGEGVQEAGDTGRGREGTGAPTRVNENEAGPLPEGETWRVTWERVRHP